MTPFSHLTSLQLPSNLAIYRVGAPTWLGINSILLGALTISMGFVGDWREFVGCRLLIGFLEVCQNYVLHGIKAKFSSLQLGRYTAIVKHFWF